MQNSANAGLVRAALVMFEPPGRGGTGPGRQRARLKLSFNPERLSLSRSASYPRTPSRGTETAEMPDYAGADPRSLSVELFLDAGDDRGHVVQGQVELLMSCCAPTRASLSSAPSPPWVRLEWGRSRSTCFNAYVTRVDATYTLFDRDGTPLRAVCQVALEEVGGQVARQNPTSGIPTPLRAHRLVAGDTLASLAWHTYGDPAEWRTIARANDIDDPLRVRPGTELILPALTEEGS
ncbi:CIS tube protein [Streptomyces orinoci]|uniref:LysM peptidoglycan-binding domain-containing protein n=1 Tax=Streptomyces orinoci TaxID=67339 RepID=A0ABV3K0G5_STRON|nr:LysM peptidoglycan-binding domain-containing protein [Streptomyces orinoci]